MLRKIAGLIWEKVPPELKVEGLTTPLGSFARQGLSLEITRRCNLKCKMCYREGLKLNDEKQLDFKLKDLFRILPKLRNFVSFSLISVGEPLLHPKLGEFIRILRKLGKSVIISTNAVLMDEHRAREFVDLGVDRIHVSIDGAKAETFERIRRGAKYERVLENVKNLAEIKRERNLKNPRIEVTYVGMRKNVEEFPEFIKIAGEMGVEGVRLKHPLPVSEEVDWQHMHRFPRVLQSVRAAAENVAEHYDMELALPSLKPEPKVCFGPWHMPYLTIEGIIRPCCLMGGFYSNFRMCYMGEEFEIDASIFDMGNIFKESWERIWNGSKYASFRNGLKEKMGETRGMNWNVEKYKEHLANFASLQDPLTFCKFCPGRFRIA